MNSPNTNISESTTVNESNSANAAENDNPLLLVSSENLQTTILTTILKDGLERECQQVDAEQVADVLQDNQLLLVDCNIYSPEQTHQMLYSIAGKAEFLVALFNSEQHGSYEALVHWPQVKGIFYTSTSQDKLILGLKEILNGGHWLPRHVMQNLLEQYRRSPRTKTTENPLTRREQHILKQLAEGLTNQEIADRNHVSEHTVKSHLYNVFKKIGVRNRLEAGNWAKKHLS